MLWLAIDLAVLAILARVWYSAGKASERKRINIHSGKLYNEAWEAGYEAAVEAEDESIYGFETEYNWREFAPERGRHEKANQATH
jgi:hypothetical protein